jgi:hypothetical protein
LGNALAHFAHSGAIAIDFGCAFETNHGIFQQKVFPKQAGVFGSPADGRADEVGLHRLTDEIESALADVIEGQSRTEKIRDKNDRKRWIEFTSQLEDSTASTIRNFLFSNGYVKIIAG